ncbi:hypothetical protein DL96DRAFT_275951 [Flagelloscypha sp. PMI_526]|nr:hypothetical protein DL96DRAFT_275951 [Flagelloscypha sp. PMI_526]
MPTPPHKKSQPSRQSFSNTSIAVPHPRAYPDPAFMTSQQWQSPQMMHPPSRAHPYPMDRSQFWIHSPPVGLSTWPQSQPPRLSVPSRPRSQPPPSDWVALQSEARPPLPTAEFPQSSMHQQPASPATTTQPNVTNWCTKLMDFAKKLKMRLSHEEVEVNTIDGRMWSVKYFLNDFEYGHCIQASKKRAKQDAACQAYQQLSREHEKWLRRS